MGRRREKITNVLVEQQRGVIPVYVSRAYYSSKGGYDN